MSYRPKGFIDVCDDLLVCVFVLAVLFGIAWGIPLALAWTWTTLDVANWCGTNCTMLIPPIPPHMPLTQPSDIP